MSRPPRKSMAELSDQSRRVDPVPKIPEPDQPSGHAPSDHASRDDVSSGVTERGIPTKRVRGRIEPDGKRTVIRREKPHTSVYMHPAAMRKLREFPAAEDCKPHDVLLEGLRMVFARFGYDFDQLDRGG